MTTALTAFVYTTALSAGLLIGDTTQQVVALLVALLLVGRLVARRHQRAAVRHPAAPVPAPIPATSLGYGDPVGGAS